MQSVISRIWTRVAASISYADDHYTTGITETLNFIDLYQIKLFEIELFGHLAVYQKIMFTNHTFNRYVKTGFGIK